MKAIKRALIDGGLWAPLSAVLFIAIAKAFSSWMPQWMQATSVVLWWGLMVFGVVWVWLFAPDVRRVKRARSRVGNHN